ncbi:S28 family serine protease [Myxococcus landrumensis]|uniref:Multidrug transporter n=1 Tax=Myxococcus landrumensis TaxID=2813577 RepID=A0ABX7NCQ6_9BACT|nr:S28 family serine protease [Myxococcus landrumus]QSQ16443.1 multidrug transporter [Myxococcus landrumus]
MSSLEHLSRRCLLLVLCSLAVGCGEEEGPPEEEDILRRLSAIPGLTVREEPVGPGIPADHRFFVMEFDQPADHAHPEGQRFRQKLTLLHASSASPMVLYTSGYFVSTAPSRREPTQWLSANQLSIEHRFFGTSRPAPADWGQLTIRQSADDFHRIVEAFKPLYPGRWISTGASKGGETMVFFRRFHPNDVDATVAYVAPLARFDDDRFIAFQESVGEASCRERLKSFQHAALDRREALLAEMDTRAARRGLTYDHLGREVALEHAIIEHYFYFWQYDAQSRCGTVPSPSASVTALMDELEARVDMASFSDGQVAAYGPYNYQAAVELGYPRPFETHLAGRLQFPGTDTPMTYVPRGVSTSFQPGAMPDIQDWVSREGERLMFVYGGHDPWSAAPYALGGARDSVLYTVPGGNHGARLALLPEAQRNEARELLRQWAGLGLGASGLRTSTWRPEPEGEEWGPRLGRPLSR